MSDSEFLKANTRLTGAALHAMTCFVTFPSAERAQLVARHLECIAEHPSAGDALQSMCSALAMRWRGWIMANVTRQHLLI